MDGVTESLTTDLSRINGAFVIACNTAFTFLVLNSFQLLTFRSTFEGWADAKILSRKNHL